MVLVYTLALMASLLFFIGAVFWFSTTALFAVSLWSGIWWFAFVATLLLAVLLLWTFFTPTYKLWARVLILVFGVVMIGVLSYLGSTYRPFHPSNIRLGAIFGESSGLDYINFDDLPEAKPEVDFVAYMPPVISQGSCSGCWATAAAAVLSARINIADNRTTTTALSTSSCTGMKYDMWRVSAQTLLDADDLDSKGVGKCNSAPFAEGFKLAQSSGSLTAQCVPFFAGDEPNCKTWCGSPEVDTTLSGTSPACLKDPLLPYVWRDCTDASASSARSTTTRAYLIRGEEAMKRELSENGPILCTLNFYTKLDGNRAIWTLAGKSSSVYVSPGFVAKPEMDGDEYTKSFQGGGHTVAIYGYGVSGDGTPYWAIQNSWGETWGNRGRMKIQRGIDAWNIETYCAAGLY